MKQVELQLAVFPAWNSPGYPSAKVNFSINKKGRPIWGAKGVPYLTT